MSDLTKDELRLKCAELAGWRAIADYSGEMCGKISGGLGQVPDYPNDLNSMHELEKLIPANKRAAYSHELHKQSSKSGDMGWGKATANAEHRARAFVNIMEAKLP